MSALSHLLFANVCYQTNKLKKKNVDLFLSPRKNGDLPTSMIVILLAPVFRWRRRNISRSFFWVTAGGEPTKGQKIKKQNFAPSTSKGTVSRVCSKCFRGSSSRKLGQDAWTDWEGRRFFFFFPLRFFFFLILFILFYFIFLPSLKLSRNINLIENTYCTCIGYLVIKKQQRTTNEETGQTCSIFRFWIWVGRILWGGEYLPFPSKDK